MLQYYVLERIIKRTIFGHAIEHKGRKKTDNILKGRKKIHNILK